MVKASGGGKPAIVTSDTVQKSRSANEEEHGEIVQIELDHNKKETEEEPKKRDAEGQVSVIVYNNANVNSRLSMGVLTDQEPI